MIQMGLQKHLKQQQNHHRILQVTVKVQRPQQQKNNQQVHQPKHPQLQTSR